MSLVELGTGFHRRKAVAPLKAPLNVLLHGHFNPVSIAERRWPH